MAFTDGTVTERCAVLDAATKVATLVRQLTHGSGQVPSELTSIADTYLDDLAVALSAIGVDGLEDTQAIVSNDSTYTVTGSGKSIDSTAVVSDGSLQSLTLDTDAAIVEFGDTCGVRASTGSPLYVSGATTAISGGALSSVRLPSTAIAFETGDTITGVEPTGTWTNTVTLTISGDAVTAITLS